MKLPTLPQVTAFGRHVVSYAMGAVSMAAVIHVISNGDAANAGHAISQISDGAAQIAAGVATLASIGSGVWASLTASPKAQINAVANNPDVKKIVTTTALANATPSSKVVSQ